ncbi:hypothetical protein [Aquipseudomonas alcaligenes]|uniref:Uncharacterized protein n=1 Tax=Aquipseudomonas alcaligenes TaxID=43263 RepID=A0A1N6XUD1_AQUAC|nr:hypothetical protein [Pseudomonas alcaligenes]SIR05761.1 hypothetical protein SAMN05878282_1161 [Pseudomonas alcaligenes]
MNSQHFVLDIATAMNFVGQTVLVEQKWEQEPDSYWQCMHIIGVVLPMEGVCKHAYFMAVSVASEKPHPNELFFADIRTIRAIRHRDRQSSGNVLGRMSRPFPLRSGAALPAHRDGSFVAMNGSTGAAHP